MALDTLEVTQGVINDFFGSEKAPRGQVSESTLRHTIMSILTRADTTYVADPVVVAYDAGFVDGIADIETPAPAAPALPSNIAVVAHVPAVEEVPDPSDPLVPLVPGAAAIPGTIIIDEYKEDLVYTVTTTTTGNVDQSEFQIVEGDFDKISAHYQLGTLTISGKITADIVERPITVRFENAYYDIVEAPMLLSVALPVPTP